MLWYSITASGEAYFKAWAGSLARYGEMIDLFFSAYERLREAGSEA